MAANDTPTKEQSDKIDELRADGYQWDPGDSVAAAGVVMRRGEDVWFFGLEGEIMHNPQND